MVRFLIFQVSEAVAQPDCWVINILEYFWNIPELYPEVYLQFMPSAEIRQEIPFSSSVLHK